MGKLVQDDGWRLPEALWVRMEPLLPERLLAFAVPDIHADQVKRILRSSGVRFAIRVGGDVAKSGEGTAASQLDIAL